MKAQKLNINTQTITQRKSEQETIYYDTKFDFIRQHNGIRPNKMHLFIAPTHVGKSTLTHALIYDLVKMNKGMKILIYLTEETVKDFETAVSNFVYNFEDVNESISIMVEDKTKTDEEIKNAIETKLFHSKVDLFVIDNITTSKLYLDRKVSVQSDISIWLKSLLTETTLYIIAHTNGNNYNTEILDETHIRGSKTITNITEFMYVMQPISLNDSLFQFVRILKHRGQAVQNKFFKLSYNDKLRTIEHDRVSDFKHFKEVFTQRNRL